MTKGEGLLLFCLGMVFGFVICSTFSHVLYAQSTYLGSDSDGNTTIYQQLPGMDAYLWSDSQGRTGMLQNLTPVQPKEPC